MTADPCPRLLAERRERDAFSPLASFSDASGDRPVPEAPDPFRTCFVRDRDRVLHCGAFRRLKDKTQVFVVDEGDFYRTRLTHTLEVCQMARFLALALRLNDALAEVVALVHDIGHPPFGHTGERALGEVAGVPFDHNVQALRLVDRIENPYPDERAGLNLTHVVRRSILKHGGDPGRGAPRSPQVPLETQLVDLADSTAYQHHDLEDALRAGILREQDLDGLSLWRRAAELVGPAPADATAPQRQRAVLSRMLKLSLHDLVESTAEAMATSGARDVADVVAAEHPLARRGGELEREHAELSAFLLERYYRHPRVLRSTDVARRTLQVIVEHYLARPDELPHDYRERVDADGLERVVCDYAAGMTDRFAIEEGRRLGEARTSVPAPEDAVARLEERLGLRFRDPRLALVALTHSSARSEAMRPNERLEFLGDSVLGMLVAEDLYRRFPERAEGELSRIRSMVVSRRALARVARRWELLPIMRLGPGMRASDAIPPSVTANAVEAVLGAVYLDGGTEATRRVVSAWFEDLVLEAADKRRSTNHKSALQTFTQGRLGATPHYRVVADEGPDHAKTFTVAAIVDGVEVATASGRNKRQAEQRAAKLALEAVRRRQEGDDGDDP